MRGGEFSHPRWAKSPRIGNRLGFWRELNGFSPEVNNIGLLRLAAVALSTNFYRSTVATAFAGARSWAGVGRSRASRAISGLMLIWRSCS